MVDCAGPLGHEACVVFISLSRPFMMVQGHSMLVTSALYLHEPPMASCKHRSASLLRYISCCILAIKRCGQIWITKSLLLLALFFGSFYRRCRNRPLYDIVLLVCFMAHRMMAALLTEQHDIPASIWYKQTINT